MQRKADRTGDLRGKILQLLASPKYQPLDKSGIAEALRERQNPTAVRDALKNLERAGEIACIRKNRYVLPSTADLVTGKLSVHEAGFAFLVNEKATNEGDLFIAAQNTGTAMHGDRVVARIMREQDSGRGAHSSKRAEGRVIRILERAHDTIVGTLQHTRNFYNVVPDDPRIVHNVYVAAPSNRDGKGAKTGDKVVVRLDKWESRHVNPEGSIVEVLGAATDPGIDMLSIVRKFHLPTDFPRAVLSEANAIPQTVNPASFRDREDLREQFILTIDPDDAKDFDDAINVEALPGGGWQLGVHIADVAAYVTPGSALDKEARARGNSVYLPDRVIPMLPERLSNGVCSLKPDVERLTHSVFIQFDRNGRSKHTRFARTVIRSARRLTYREAYALLQQPPRDQLGERIHAAWSLASLLRRKRFENGSLDLDFPEVKVRVDENGRPIRLEKIENDESHQLVEEFMLAANEAVGRELKNASMPTVYRVHEDPDPQKLADYREMVLGYGLRVGDLTQRPELQRLIAMMRGKSEEQALKIGLLKSLKRARYTPQPLGHYGLAKTNYLHFTSPIRRYADLVAHRTLADFESTRRARADMSELTALSEHISITERTAAEAEMEAVKLKKLQFFQYQIDARDPQIFRAIVIDVRNYGLVIELPDALLTGMVHVSSLKDDFYTFDAVQRRFIGRKTRRRFSVGDELRVFVARVDQFKRQIDFAIADERKAPSRARTDKRRR